MTMTIDHTPGLWTIADPLEDGIEHANGVTIESPDGAVAVGVLEVDAAAIAALPDLVAALEGLLAHCSIGSDQMMKAYRAGRLAVAKAGGA